MMETIVDFWQMIWENDVEFVVMLCELEERGRQKCNQYWADSEMGSVDHGPYKARDQDFCYKTLLLCCVICKTCMTPFDSQIG